MKIEVQAFINQIQDQTYLTDEYEIPTPETLTSAPFLEKLKPAIEKAIEKQALASFSVTTTYHDEPLRVTLETGIVNLPLQYIKKVNQFFDEAAQVPVNLYLYVTSSFVNRSGMRIDEIGPLATLATDLPAAWQMTEQLLTQDLAAVIDNAQAPKVVPEEKPKKKATTKKTITKKKTATKAAAAKKTTTKKAAIKKKTTKKAD